MLCCVYGNMALNVLQRSVKNPVGLNLLRALNGISHLYKRNPYSTKPVPTEKEVKKPVKFTNSDAYRLKFSEAAGLSQKRDTPQYQRHILLASLITFMVYFCILREENDIDQMLKGDPEYTSDVTKYFQLQSHLMYCKQHKIPHADLEARVEELKEKLQRTQK